MGKGLNAETHNDVLLTLHFGHKIGGVLTTFSSKLSIDNTFEILKEHMIGVTSLQKTYVRIERYYYVNDTVTVVPNHSPAPNVAPLVNNSDASSSESMSKNAVKIPLEDLEIKPDLLNKLKIGRIESIFDLAISIPHQLIDVDGVLTGRTDCTRAG
jgi:hypothetical protein